MDQDRPGSAPEKQSRRKIKIVTLFLGLIAVILLGIYLFQNRDVFSSLKNITADQVIIIIVADIAMILISSLINYVMVLRFGFTIRFRDSLLLQYSNSFLNKILPTIGGGAAFRAIYLKKKYIFPYTDFVSTLGGFYLINFLVTSLIGLFCMLSFFLEFGRTNWVIVTIFLALLLPCLGIIIFSPKIPTKQNRVLKTVQSIVNSWNLLKSDPLTTTFFCLLIILQLIIAAWQMQAGFRSIGFSTGIRETLYLSSLGIILSLINFTPDGIGIREGVYAFTSTLVNIPISGVILGSLVLRALSILTTLIIGGVSYLVLLKEIQKIEENKNPG